MKDPLGVSHSTLIYTSELILCSTRNKCTLGVFLRIYRGQRGLNIIREGKSSPSLSEKGENSHEIQVGDVWFYSRDECYFKSSPCLFSQ